MRIVIVIIGFLMRVLAFFLIIGWSIIGCVSQPSLTVKAVQQGIFDTKQRTFISYPDLLMRLRDTPMVLIGEIHDQISHHVAEQKIILDLFEYNQLKSVMLEMIPSSQQAVLSQAQRLLRLNHQNDDSIIKRVLQWDNKWDWQQYGKLLSLIANSTINLYGANLDKNEIKVLWAGAYPLQGRLSTSNTVKQRLRKLMNSYTAQHSDSNSQPEIIDKLIEIQQFKDRRMAETLIKNHKPSLLIAGRYHVSKLFGVPLHLYDYQYIDYKVVILTDKLDAINFEEADYIWVL